MKHHKAETDTVPNSGHQRSMGNCLNISCSPAKKAKVLPLNEGDKEFRASKLVKEVNSVGSYHDYELIRSLLPHLVQPHDHSVSFKIIKKESCQGRTVKIVVTRKQLDFFLRDAKMCRSTKTAIRSSGTHKRRARKWRPSLSAIPEVPDL